MNRSYVIFLKRSQLAWLCLLGDNESAKFQSACSRFKRLFAMPEEEKLVNCENYSLTPAP